MHQQKNLRLRERVLGGPSLRKKTMLTPLGRFWVPFWLPRDFEGPIRLVFRDVCSAVTKPKQIMYFVTTVPLKLETLVVRRAGRVVVTFRTSIFLALEYKSPFGYKLSSTIYF